MQAIHRRGALIIALLTIAGAFLASDARGRPAEAALAPCPSVLVMGTSYACSIDVPGEVDQFTFSGTSGDRVYISARRTGGDISAEMAITQGATPICDGGGGICDLPSTAIYSLTVTTTNGSSGAYTLTVQSLTAPPNAETLTLGSTDTASIDAGAFKYYSIALAADDRLFLRSFGEEGTEIFADLFSPDGGIACNPSNFSDPTLEGVCEINDTGNHLLAVYNNSETTPETDISTHIQRLTNLVGATAAPAGSTHLGTIDGAEMDAYTITNPTAGDRWLLRAVVPLQTSQPELRVYNAAGTEQNCNTSGMPLAETLCQLEADGTYTVLIGNYAVATSGEYAFWLQNVTSPTTSGVANGETWLQPGFPANMLTTTLTPPENSWVWVRATTLSGTGHPELRMYNDDGTLLCVNSIPETVIMLCQVGALGTYTLLAGESGGDASSDFAVHYRIAGSSGNAIPTAPETTRTARILRAAETEYYQFQGTLGEVWEVSVFSNSDDFEPRVQFFAADGEASCSGSGQGLAFVQCNLGTSGLWRIMVMDADGRDPGSFSMFLSCPGCAPTTDRDGDGIGDAADNCPSTGNASQLNSDAAPLDIPGAAYDDHTRPGTDNAGDACDSDDDNDGLLDAVEASFGCGALNPNVTLSTTNADTDGDRSQDLYECLIGTDPSNAASKPALAGLGGVDNDQLPDWIEPYFGADFEDLDTDGDGVQDGMEVRGYFASPGLVNSDSDDCPDDTEIASINTDTVVSAIDLNQVAQRFFVTTAPAFDLNKDGTVGALDLSLQAQNFVLSPCA